MLTLDLLEANLRSLELDRDAKHEIGKIRERSRHSASAKVGSR